MSVDYSLGSSAHFNGTFDDGFETGTVQVYNDGNATAVLASTGSFSSSWSETGDFAIDGTDATYTHSTGAGTLFQVSGDLASAPTASALYKLRYTISSISGASNITVTLNGGSGYIASEDITFATLDDATYSLYFKTAADVASDKFQISVASTGTSSFNIDDISIVKADAVQLESSSNFSI